MRERETETKKQEGKAKSFLILTRGIKKDTELNLANIQVSPSKACLMTALVFWATSRGTHYKQLLRG